MKKPTVLEKLRGPQDNIAPENPEPAPEQKPAPEKKEDGIPSIHPDDLEDVRQTPSKPGLERNEADESTEEKEGDDKADDTNFSPEDLQNILWPGRKKKQKPEEKKGDAKAEEEQAKPEAKKGEAAKEPKKAKKPVVEEDDEEPVDTGKLVKDAVSSAVEATARALKQTEKQEESEPEIELDEDEQYLATVYDRIEKDDGVKGVGKKFRDGVLKMKEYRRKWEADHPGEEWDAESDEHSAYYEKVMPDVPSRLVRAAEARLATEETVEKKTRGIKEENAELKRKVFDTEAAPAIAQTTDEMLVNIAKSIGEEVGEAIRTPDGVKSLEEADPVAVEVIRGFASHAATLNVELTRISRSNGLYRVDDKNPAHQEIRGIVKTAQEQIKALPRSKRVWRGREFATHAEWGRMTPAEQENHWILDEDRIRAIITEQYSGAAKSAYDREMAKIERYGGARKTSKKAKPAEQEASSKDEDEEPTPSAPTRDAIPSVKGGAQKSGDSLGEKLRRQLWGR